MKSKGEDTLRAVPAKPQSDRLRKLGSEIRDLGYEIDSRKTGVAAAMGGGVFLLLLATGAFYDLASGNTSIWNIIGATRDVVWIIAVLLAAAGGGLLAWGVVRHRRRDAEAEEALARMQLEYEELRDREAK
jgi:hypothetical protein